MSWSGVRTRRPLDFKTDLALPGLGRARAAGGRRGLPGGPVRGHEPVRHPRKRVTIMPKDIQLARRIRGERS